MVWGGGGGIGVVTTNPTNSTDNENIQIFIFLQHRSAVMSPPKQKRKNNRSQEKTNKIARRPDRAH